MPRGGSCERPSEAELTRLREAVRRADPDAIAISLLFSFANPENEAAVAAAVAELGKPLSVSHRILPEFREYERTSTVVVNAYLQPLMQSYMERLAERAQQSRRIGVLERARDDGAADRVAERRRSCRESLSCNRAAGLRRWSRRHGNRCARCCRARRADWWARRRWPPAAGSGRFSPSIWEEPRPTWRQCRARFEPGGQSEVAGLPVGVPMLEIHTVGAGGGSLARFDAGGVAARGAGIGGRRSGADLLWPRNRAHGDRRQFADGAASS